MSSSSSSSATRPSSTTSKSPSSEGASGLVSVPPQLERFRLGYAASITQSPLNILSATRHKRVCVCNYKLPSTVSGSGTGSRGGGGKHSTSTSTSTSTAAVVAIKTLPKLADMNALKERARTELRRVMHDGFREDESTGRTAGRVESEARRVCGDEMGRAGRRMGRELGVLCALGSGQENVMGVYGFIETPVEVLVVCEYVGGETLVERLEKYGADFSEGRAAEIARQIASGLEYLHDKSIVHGNLHPEHIVFKSTYKGPESSTKLVITGFSESTVVRSEPTRSPPEEYHISSFGAFSGPDKVLDARNYPKTDTWSFGAIVFYMLYGKLPYPDAKAPEDIRRSNLVFPKSGISSEAIALIQSCLSKDVHSRPYIKDIRTRRKWLTQTQDGGAKFGVRLHWKSSLADYTRTTQTGSRGKSSRLADENVGSRFASMKTIVNDGDVLKYRKKLGEGAYGSVFQGELTLKGGKPSVLAVKTISKKVDYDIVLGTICRKLDELTRSNALAGLSRDAILSKVGKIARTVYEKIAHHLFVVCQRELGPWMLLDHKNIVRYLGAWQNQPQEVYFFMEEAQGGTLQSYLKRHGRLSDRQMAILSYQLFSGLEAMEKAQVVHRDIKPDNILLLYPGDPSFEYQVFKFCDFGGSKCMNGKQLMGYSQYGTMIYTPPEVLNLQSYDCQANVWAVTVILIEAFLGTLNNDYGLFWVNNPAPCARQDLEHCLVMKGKSKEELDSLDEQRRRFLNVEAAIYNKITKMPLMDTNGPAFNGLSRKGRDTLARGFLRNPKIRSKASSLLRSNPWYEQYDLYGPNRSRSNSVERRSPRPRSRSPSSATANPPSSKTNPGSTPRKSSSPKPPGSSVKAPVQKKKTEDPPRTPSSTSTLRGSKSNTSADRGSSSLKLPPKNGEKQKKA